MPQAINVYNNLIGYYNKYTKIFFREVNKWQKQQWTLLLS